MFLAVELDLVDQLKYFLHNDYHPIVLTFLRQEFSPKILLEGQGNQLSPLLLALTSSCLEDYSSYPSLHMLTYCHSVD